MELDIKAILTNYTQINIFLLMFSLGLMEGFQGISTLWRQPSLLFRCLIAAFILVPLSGIAILAIFPLSTDARIGILAMAVCPGAPLLYKKLTSMKANASLAGSFQVTTTLLAILLIPVLVVFLGKLYPAEVSVPAIVVFQQVTTVQFIPICIGLGLRQWLSNLADDLQEPVTKLGSFMFLGLVLVILVVALPSILKVGPATVLAVIVFVGISIVLGHYLGGPDPETRLSIALANSTRNAGLAFALVALNFEEPGGILVVVASIALIAFIGDAIYANFYRKQTTQ